MRGFIAINLPDPVRHRLYAAAAPLREAVRTVRWVAPESLHLTLKFLGHFADTRIGELVDAIRAAAAPHAPFTLRIAGAGAFPNRRRPRVWWLGIIGSEPLLALQRSIDEATAALGFASETRPYTPHLTIGRAKGDARVVPEAAALLDAFADEAAFEVASVELMSSKLLRTGARYDVVERAPLAGSSTVARTTEIGEGR